MINESFIAKISGYPTAQLEFCFIPYHSRPKAKQDLDLSHNLKSSYKNSSLAKGNERSWTHRITSRVCMRFMSFLGLLRWWAAGKVRQNILNCCSNPQAMNPGWNFMPIVILHNIIPQKQPFPKLSQILVQLKILTAKTGKKGPYGIHSVIIKCYVPEACLNFV